MMPLNMIGVPREATGAETSSNRLPIPLHIAEDRASTTPPVAQPIPGHLCEECLDAPAVALVSAPWGGQMGVCDPCQQARAVATLPVLTAREGQQTIWHTIDAPDLLAAYRAAAATPLPTWWDRCVSAAPARVCVCGSYRLIWGEDEEA